MSIIRRTSPYCFYYSSIYLFLVALLCHCVMQKGSGQLIFAGIVGFFVLIGLVIYWLTTEPCNDVDSLPPERRVVFVSPHCNVV